jgi:hypothetical protein
MTQAERDPSRGSAAPFSSASRRCSSWSPSASLEPRRSGVPFGRRFSWIRYPARVMKPLRNTTTSAAAPWCCVFRSFFNLVWTQHWENCPDPASRANCRTCQKPKELLRGPDCNRHKREFASIPSPPLRHRSFREPRRSPECVFFGMAESIGPMGVLRTIKDWGRVPPRVGRPRGPAKGRDGRGAPASFAMSSDRLFLDRVARQHCPPPLHRHAQTTMRLLPASSNRTFLLCRE